MMMRSMDWLTQTDVWVTLAIVLFGLLVVWGAIRDFVNQERRERSAVKVAGKIVEIVAVQVPTDTRPFAAAIVEYTVGMETKRFQTETLVTNRMPGEPQSFRQRGDPVTVHIPGDGGEPWIGRPTARVGLLVVQVFFGLAVIGCAFVVRLVLLQI